MGMRTQLSTGLSPSAGRMKAPAFYRFSRGAVERFAA